MKEKILGVEQEYGRLLSNIDINTITSNCKALYAGAEGVSHKPEENVNEFTLICKNVTEGFSSPRIIQYAYYKNGHSYYRYATDTNGVVYWEDWSRLDNFGCTTPSALAELLGATNTLIASGSFDDIKTNGEYTISANVTDGPSTIDQSFSAQLQLKVWGKAGDIIQLATRTGQNIHAIRTFTGSDFTAWKAFKFN